jgi:hypothetical protein
VDFFPRYRGSLFCDHQLPNSEMTYWLLDATKFSNLQ